MYQLFETQKIILSQFKQQFLYHRAAFDKITLDNQVTGVVGNRSIGKTAWV